METKKSKKADLESKRPIFFMIGLAIALSSVLLAFEWKTPVTKVEDFGDLKLETPEEEMMEVIREEKKEIAPPVKEVLEFEIVEDDMEIETDLEIFDSEIEQDEAINYEDYLTEDNNKEEEVGPTWFPEQMPEFPGGNLALLKFINKSVNYPIVAQESGVQGKVIVTFVINKKGNVTDVRVLRGVDVALDAEAVRVVKKMPPWKPGMQAGRAVSVHFNVPISFVLQ